MLFKTIWRMYFVGMPFALLYNIRQSNQIYQERKQILMNDSLFREDNLEKAHVFARDLHEFRYQLSSTIVKDTLQYPKSLAQYLVTPIFDKCNDKIYEMNLEEIKTYLDKDIKPPN